ncbi:FapA family protein [Moorellaceae bacterium AZ2]
MNEENSSLRVYAALKDGRLLLRHPREGPYPIIIPGTGIKIKHNGKECSGPVAVTDQDTVEIETFQEEVREGGWEIEVSPDSMSAILKVKPHRRIRYRLKDLPPSQILRVEAETEETLYLPFTMTELANGLRQLGIVYGIDWNTINQVLAEPKEQEVEIARGTPARPGRDAEIEILFSLAEKTQIEMAEDAKVDLWERFRYTAVQPGELLARKHPGQPGSPGQDIRGNVLAPPVPRDVTLEAGDGALLAGEGTVVMAMRAGRPVVIPIAGGIRVQVVNVLNHIGDVDKHSGHLRFTGDIVITGNVLEGMRVESGESIIIEGMVSGAEIRAQESVSVRGNVHSSTIVAGEKFSLLKNLLPLLRKLSDQLRGLNEALLQMRKNYTGSTGPLVKLLIERKFAGIPAAVLILKKYLEGLPFEYTDLKYFVMKADEKLVKHPLSISRPEEIEQLYGLLVRLMQEIEGQDAAGGGNVITGYILASRVNAAGDVIVTRIGCDNCLLEAGKGVIVRGSFRGGEIHAGGDVYVEELGTEGGAKTLVIAGENSTVTIGRAFENSAVRLGQKTHRFVSEVRKIKVRMDAGGYVQVIPL